MYVISVTSFSAGFETEKSQFSMFGFISTSSAAGLRYFGLTMDPSPYQPLLAEPSCGLPLVHTGF
jgi:hypothetical protein